MKKAKRHIKIRTEARGIKANFRRIRERGIRVQTEHRSESKYDVHTEKKEVFAEPPDNPDVSAHLTNLSLRHSGSRPAWFDLEPLKLPGRSRQCRRVYWKIVEEQVLPRKKFFVLTAAPGMGKTSFLAELHDLIEHSSQSFLTLAPGKARKTPFYALRSILEQRFYVSGDVSFECIERFVRGAVCSLIDTPDAASVSDSVLALWRPDKKENPIEKAVEKPKSVPVPPPLATRITSMDEILKAHEASQGKKGKLPDQSVDVPQNELPPKKVIDADNAEDSDEATFVIPTNRNEETKEKSSEQIDAMFKELELPLKKLLHAEVKHNSLVIMIDDVEEYDDESLDMLGRLFVSLPEEVPLTFFAATADKSLLPAGISQCPVEFIELSALSDRDLAQLSHHALMKLSETRERLIVPKDICNLIAQKSYGSPKRVMDLTLKHFNPDCIIHWNDAIEQLCREPLPACLGQNLIRRYRECPESERLILQVSSLLNAPFTISTIECLVSSCQHEKTDMPFSCAALLKNLRENGFLERAESVFGPHTICYAYKHECERLLICSSVGEEMRRSVLRAAAQWYSINNSNGDFDEMTGDLWRNYHFMHEACRCYERAAYRARNHSQLSKAWLLFRKLLKSLPDGNISDRIKFSLDGAEIAFMTGQIDEAFRLCRLACHHATMISAYVQAARACIQIADMMTELGTVRHISRYIRRARIFLSHDSDLYSECKLYSVLAKRDIYVSRLKSAQKNLAEIRLRLEKIKTSLHDKLYFDWLEAEIEMQFGNTQNAFKMLNSVIQQSEQNKFNRIRALAFRSLGHLEYLSGNISGALDAWNIGLGIVQETNDSVLHANFLADIADGALQLSARRTARAATEECLCLAQQTHHKSLIAHCLANTAFLQYMNGQPEKALRSVRKAHRTAAALKCVTLWSRTLSLFALLYSTHSCRIYDLDKSRKIFSSLERVYEYHGMMLSKAQHYVLEAGILTSQKEIMMAVNTYRKALSLYVQFGMDKSAEKVQIKIDELISEMKA